MDATSGTAIAGGALSGALTALIVAKGILDRDELGIVITNAMWRFNALGDSADVQNAKRALSTIARMHAHRKD